MKTVSITSTNTMDTTINSYLAEGYVVSQRGEKTTTLQKQKKFNIASLLLLLVPFIGWLALVVYVIMYSMKPDAEVLTIQVEGAAVEPSGS